MKKLIPILILCLISFSCKQSETTQIAKKTIISGQLNDVSVLPEHEIIQIIVHDLLDFQTTITEFLDEEGNFRFELDLDHPTEFYLEYSSLLTFFVYPGDSIHFIIDGDCWRKITDTYAEEYSFYNVSGTSEAMNKEVAAYTAFFIDSINEWEFSDSVLRNSTAMEFKKFIHQRTAEWRELIADYNKEHRTSAQFQHWVALKMECDEWDELMRYRWLYPMHHKLDRKEFLSSIPNEYFDFLNDCEIENKEYMQCHEYFWLVHEYTMYLDQLIPDDSLTILYAPDTKENFERKNNLYISYCETFEPGFVRDLLLAKYYYRILDKKDYEKLKDLFNPALIQDIALREKIIAKFESERELYENPQFAEGSKLNSLEAENDFLKELTMKYQGKVLYLDFWAPWCSPCLGEMPSAKKIHDAFEGKDVVFVYLANRCEESAWKTLIAEKKIEGEHFRLNDSQYAQLVEIFGIKGIPHYAVLDKQGMIVKKNAPRPSENKALTELLDSCL